MVQKLISCWYQLSLKKKMYFVIGVVGITMVIAIMSNVRVVYVLVDNEKKQMDDNMSSYHFQEAFQEEVYSFTSLVKDRSEENEAFYKTAVEQTKDRLQALELTYAEATERRYAIIWNIQNSYAEYEKQRDKFIVMSVNDSDYISELYRTYQIQEYIESYATRLTREVMESNASYYDKQMSLVRRMPYRIFASSCIAVAVLVLVSRMMTKGFITTLFDLAKASKDIESNKFHIPDIQWRGSDEMGQLVCAFNKMKHATASFVETLKEKHEMEQRIYKYELEKANLEQRIAFAQLQLLKSQINPHFLFNTLNMITRMSQYEEAPTTEEMLIALSNLFRYSLRTSEPFTPLEQELKVLRDYMYIQKMRFGSRVSWIITSEVEVNKIEIPVFLIQPLVENSVIHGLTEKEDGGSINVRVFEKDELLYIIVEDTGMGMEEEKLNEIREAIKGREGSVGIGLGNIYRRLLAYYENSEVTVESTLGEGTTVSLKFGKRR